MLCSAKSWDISRCIVLTGGLLDENLDLFRKSGEVSRLVWSTGKVMLGRCWTVESVVLGRAQAQTVNGQPFRYDFIPMLVFDWETI